MARTLAKRHNARIFCHDELIKANSEQSGATVKHQMHKDAAAALLEGRNVILDAMYTSKHYRKQVLAAVKGVPCEKILLVLKTPYEECLRRNANRAHPIPESVIEWTQALYQAPDISEGWDKIVEVKI